MHRIVPGASRAPRESSRLVASPPTLLLVDDDTYLVQTLVPLLQTAYPGAKVHGTYDYHEGLQKARELEGKLVVVSDFDLKEARDGADLLAEVERLRPEAGRILMSGHSRDTLAYAFVRCRPHAFVQKPFRLEDMVPPLMAAIRQALGEAAAPAPQDGRHEDVEIYRMLVESVKDYAIFMLDPGGHIQSWNPGAERIKGYAAKEVVGKHFRLFYTMDDQARKHPETELQIALSQGRYEEEGVRVRRDGSRFWANIVLTPLFDANGRHRGFVKVTRDLTARKAAEEQMRRHARQLEELSHELEAFSYTVAHDLRSPLRAISHELSLMEQTPGDLPAHIGRAREHVDKMVELIDDLLMLAQSSKGDLHMGEVDLSGLAREVADTVYGRHRRDPAEVQVQDGIKLRGDARGLRVVLDNLISNACKFTRDAKEPNVEVGAMRTPQGHVVFVRDNGVGFDTTRAGHLFRPFQRLHGGTQFEGTGLGLATVRRIVERHGGRAWLDGRPGEGATAYFLIHAPEAGAFPAELMLAPPIVQGSHRFQAGP